MLGPLPVLPPSPAPGMRGVNLKRPFAKEKIMIGFTRTTVRKSRKVRECNTYRSRCDAIKPGELYNEHVVSPGLHDFGEFSHWVRQAECGRCAAEAGRPIPGYEPAPQVVLMMDEVDELQVAPEGLDGLRALAELARSGRA